MAVAEAKAIAPSRRWDLGAVLKDCVLAALVACRTFHSDPWRENGMDRRRQYHPALSLAGRDHRLRRRLRRPAALSSIRMEPQHRNRAHLRGFEPPSGEPRIGQISGPVVLLCALVLPFMPFSDRYVMDVSILIADLCHARLGTAGRRRPRRSARSGLCGLLRRRRLFLRPPTPISSVSPSGSVCRWPACWRHAGDSFWASPFCG